MRDCIIHIGLHKTGSTAIQHSLYRNPSLRGVTYLDFGKANSGSQMLAAFDGPPKGIQRFKDNGLPADWLDQQARQGREVLEAGLAGPHERVMLSAEGLSRLEQKQINTLRDLVLRHGRRPVIVAYVRGVRGAMESALQQRAKGGAIRVNPYNLMPHYRDVLEPWDLAFGRDNVLLFPFVPTQLLQGCVVRDLCQRLDLSLDESTIVRANTGLSRSAVSLMFLYWRACHHTGKELSRRESQALLGLVSEVPGEKLRLSPTLIHKAVQRNAAQLEWIEQRMGLSMGDLGQAGAGDIRNEQDLCTLNNNTHRWLEEQLGREIPSDADEQTLGAAMLALATQSLHQERKTRRSKRSAEASEAA